MDLASSAIESTDDKPRQRSITSQLSLADINAELSLCSAQIRWIHSPHQAMLSRTFGVVLEILAIGLLLYPWVATRTSGTITASLAQTLVACYGIGVLLAIVAPTLIYRYPQWSDGSMAKTHHALNDALSTIEYLALARHAFEASHRAQLQNSKRYAMWAARYLCPPLPIIFSTASRPPYTDNASKPSPRTGLFRLAIACEDNRLNRSWLYAHIAAHKLALQGSNYDQLKHTCWQWCGVVYYIHIWERDKDEQCLSNALTLSDELYKYTSTLSIPPTPRKKRFPPELWVFACVIVVLWLGVLILVTRLGLQHAVSAVSGAAVGTVSIGISLFSLWRARTKRD